MQRAMRQARRAGSLLSCAVLCAACGSTQKPEAAPAERSAGAEAGSQRPRMEVEGLMGTIPERKILATLEPKLPSFQRCFERAAARVELIGGRMELYFRVGLDGRVEWVYPRTSTVGDRGTEQCLLEIAKAARFPEPKGGGAAELAWGFEIDAPDGVRPPVAWDEAHIESTLRAEHATLEACGALGWVVTAYVAPGGKVMAAGASAPSHEAEGGIDCVLRAVRGWSLPDPGSYPAKVSFRVQ
jgi:hypothetical protein